MKIKALCFNIFLLFIGLKADAQVLRLLDLASGDPIELAAISSLNPRLFVLTNTKGEADMSPFVSAERIEFRAQGYKPQIRSYEWLKTNGFVLRMEASNIYLDELVVSATRWSQSTRDIPSRIIGLNAREVRFQNPQTAADLLGSTGEVFIQKSQQGGGSPMIRGFSANRLVYSVDGVRMNTAIFRSGNLQNVISLDPFAIERTEVFFGPGSVIYGSDAIGGVMSFQTLSPKFSQGDSTLISGNVAYRNASANRETTGHMDLMAGWKKWAILSSITHSRFGDLRMGTNGPEDYLRTFYVQRMDSMDRIVENPNPLIQTPTGYEQINLLQKVRYAAGKNLDLEYGFHYSATSDYSRYDRLIEMQNGRPRSAEWNYGPQKWMMNALHVQHKSKSALYNDLSVRAAWQQFEESRIDRNFSGGNRFRRRTQTEKVDAWSLNADFELENGRHQSFYGVEVVINQVSSVGKGVDIRSGAELPVADRYPQSLWQSYAAYLNHQLRFSEKWLLQGGVRYNLLRMENDFSRHLEFYPFDFNRSTLNNDALTGSIGAVFTPTKEWQISLNASSGFRAPNVDDIGKIFDFADGEIVVPNTRLSPEYAYNGELNVAKIFGDVLKLDASVYYTYLDGAMVRRPFQVNGSDSILFDGTMSKVYAIQNAAFSQVFGFQAGMELRLPSGWSLQSRYNYQRGEEEMDNGSLSASRHAAPAFGITRLSYTRKRTLFQVYAQYAAEVAHERLNEEERQKPFLYAKDEKGNPYSPAWYTLNFKMSHEISRGITVNAGVENLTDQRYRPYSSGLSAAGRNFIFSVQGKF